MDHPKQETLDPKPLKPRGATLQLHVKTFKKQIVGLRCNHLSWPLGLVLKAALREELLGKRVFKADPNRKKGTMAILGKVF